VPVGFTKKNETQHRGIGKKLLNIAEWVAFMDSNNYNGIAVISGIGVMNYYEKLGYQYKDTFMIKKFKTTYENMIIVHISALAGINNMLWQNAVVDIYGILVIVCIQVIFTYMANYYYKLVIC